MFGQAVMESSQVPINLRVCVCCNVDFFTVAIEAEEKVKTEELFELFCHFR